MTLESVEKSIKILKWAIDNKKSILEAQKQFNVSESYVRKTKFTHGHKDDSQVREFIRLYKAFLNKESKEINYNDGLLTNKDIIVKEETSFLQDIGVLDARGNNHVKTIDQLIKEAKIDLSIWNIDKHVVNKWDVTTGHGSTYQNWQVKAWLSKNKEKEKALSVNDYLNELLKNHNPHKYKPVAYKKVKERNLLEICIYDAHVGKLCWSEENRGEDYDIKIASKRFNDVVRGAIKRASGSDFEKILFAIGNDFFNSDTILNTTTNGTPQDEDTRWQKTFKLGFKLLVEAIDYMRQFAPVDVVVIPGNHDETRSYFVGHSLESWYRCDKSVNIDNSSPSRKYYRYGETLLGLTHGNEEKEDRLPQLMAYEAKKDWSETKYHEWHLAHLHKKMANKYKLPIYNEDLGVIIRRLSSIAGTDKWHFSKAYVGTLKAAEAFLWNFDDGLLSHYNINIKF